MLYGNYQFFCHLKNEVILPHYKGSTFRGVFGRALKKVVCALKKEDCEDCLLKKRCGFKLAGILHGVVLLILFCLPKLSMGQSIDEALKLSKQADQLYQRGHYFEALPLIKRALDINEKTFGPESKYVALTLNQLAGLYNSLGDYLKAVPLYKRALKINENIFGAEHEYVAFTLIKLAASYHSLGQYDKAEPLYKRALVIYEKALGPEHPNVATSLNHIAAFYQNLGDYARGEALIKRALEIYEKVLGPEHPHVATNLNNLALLYYSLGDYTKAEPLYKRALAIHEKALGPEHMYVAADLNNLAILYFSLDDFARAESLYKRAMEIYKETLGLEHPYAARSLNNLAFLYLAEGRIEKAFRIFDKQGDLLGLGACYLAKSNYEKAEWMFQKSLKYNQTSGEKKYLISDHIGLGLSYEGMGDLTRARRHFKKAIDLIEAQWQTLSFSARKKFLAGEVGANFSRLDAFEGMVRVIIKEKKRGYQKEALLYAEKVKSRTLLEMLSFKGVKGIAKNDREILTKDRQFQQEIFTKKKRLSKLLDLGWKAPEEEKQRLDQALNETLQDYERFIHEVKLQDTELASLITVEAVPLEKIQSLLDPSTTILEYFTTKDKTYAWVITKDNIKVHELNLEQKNLVAMVNDFLLPNISNRSRRPRSILIVPTSRPQAEKASRQEREKNRRCFLKASQDFYHSLLEPVEADLHTNRLIVVPHGALHKVPFTALNDGKQFMVDKYAISIVPSSTVIEYVVKKRNQDKGRFLAFGNPETDYVPLGFAEIEVNNLSKFFSKKEIYFKREATEAKAKELCKYPDVIHFACHGEFNDKQPMQSGLLLSKDADNDGYLQVHEIFGLDFKNVNLVVLSACETALSKIYGGDDLVGLSRGFIYAGTPSLLATLWAVDDRSTSILIEKFYENWLIKGMKKTEALQKAQVALKSMPEYQHPFYWAPFVLIGDWS